MSKKHPNYPSTGWGESVHHIAWPASAYSGPLAHRDFRHDKSMLLPVKNTRHNLGRYALHSLLRPPIKPIKRLMGDMVDFMQDEVDRDLPRIGQFSQVIGFLALYAEETPFDQLAQQSYDLNHHYTQQKFIIEHGGEAWVQAKRLEEAA